MAKYNFSEQREIVRKGGKLPADINSFVKKQLEKFGALTAIKRLEEKEKHIRFGKILTIDPANPHRRLEFDIEYGMVHKFNIIEEFPPALGETWYTVDTTPIKNPDLSNKTPEKPK